MSRSDTITLLNGLVGQPVRKMEVSYADTSGLLEDIDNRVGTFKDAEAVAALLASKALRAAVVDANTAQRRNPKTRWSKHFAKALWAEAKVKLDASTVSVIANLALERQVNLCEYVDIAKLVDWSDGYFGKDDSCWFHDSSIVKWNEQDNTFCLRFWNANKEGRVGNKSIYSSGIGRMWLWVHDDGVLAFNLYYHDSDVGAADHILRPIQACYIARNLTEMAAIYRVSVGSDQWYVNDNSAYLLAADEGKHARDFTINPAPKSTARLRETGHAAPPVYDAPVPATGNWGNVRFIFDDWNGEVANRAAPLPDFFTGTIDRSHRIITREGHVSAYNTVDVTDVTSLLSNPTLLDPLTIPNSYYSTHYIPNAINAVTANMFEYQATAEGQMDSVDCRAMVLMMEYAAMMNGSELYRQTMQLWQLDEKLSEIYSNLYEYGSHRNTTLWLDVMTVAMRVTIRELVSRYTASMEQEVVNLLNRHTPDVYDGMPIIAATRMTVLQTVNLYRYCELGYDAAIYVLERVSDAYAAATMPVNTGVNASILATTARERRNEQFNRMAHGAGLPSLRDMLEFRVKCVEARCYAVSAGLVTEAVPDGG